MRCWVTTAAIGLAWAAALLSPPALASRPPDPARDERIEHGRFKPLHLYKPEGPARSTALLFSSQRGWDREADAYARALRSSKTLVAGIDTPALLKVLAQDGDNCEFLDGDLDNLSRFVQAYTRQDDYRPPLLMGLDESAALVFGALSQAPPKSFSGGVGVGFCPFSPLRPPLCAGTGLRQRHEPGGGSTILPTSRLQSPFFAVATPASEACGARDFTNRVDGAELRWPVRRQAGAPSAVGAALLAYGTLAANIAPAHRKPEALPDLPLVEVAASRDDPSHRDLLAVLLSGDGGWAGLDEEIADRLAAEGIPVVGLDSLRYFWTERKPDDVALDLGRLIHHYVETWKRPRVMLIGYSQGADVLPFALNRMPPSLRQQITLTAAIALSKHAAFEFHVGAWAGQAGDFETRPEVDQLAGAQDLLIICGQNDDAAICPELDPARHRMRILPGSHHFEGNYALLAKTLIDGLSAPEAR